MVRALSMNIFLAFFVLFFSHWTAAAEFDKAATKSTSPPPACPTEQLTPKETHYHVFWPSTYTPRDDRLYFTKTSGISVIPDCNDKNQGKSFLVYPVGLVLKKISERTINHFMASHTYWLVETEYGLRLFIPKHDIEELDQNKTYFFANTHDGRAPYCIGEREHCTLDRLREIRKDQQSVLAGGGGQGTAYAVSDIITVDTCEILDVEAHIFNKNNNTWYSPQKAYFDPCRLPTEEEEKSWEDSNETDWDSSRNLRSMKMYRNQTIKLVNYQKMNSVFSNMIEKSGVTAASIYREYAKLSGNSINNLISGCNDTKYVNEFVQTVLYASKLSKEGIIKDISIIERSIRIYTGHIFEEVPGDYTDKPVPVPAAHSLSIQLLDCEVEPPNQHLLVLYLDYASDEYTKRIEIRFKSLLERACTVNNKASFCTNLGNGGNGRPYGIDNPDNNSRREGYLHNLRSGVSEYFYWRDVIRNYILHTNSINSEMPPKTDNINIEYSNFHKRLNYLSHLIMSNIFYPVR